MNTFETLIFIVVLTLAMMFGYILGHSNGRYYGQMDASQGKYDYQWQTNVTTTTTTSTTNITWVAK